MISDEDKKSFLAANKDRIIRMYKNLDSTIQFMEDLTSFWVDMRSRSKSDKEKQHMLLQIDHITESLNLLRNFKELFFHEN